MPDFAIDLTLCHVVQAVFSQIIGQIHNGNTDYILYVESQIKKINNGMLHYSANLTFFFK